MDKLHDAFGMITALTSIAHDELQMDKLVTDWTGALWERSPIPETPVLCLVWDIDNFKLGV